jgi:hypothetical protein
MKKIILTLVMLLLAAPASAEVFIYCAADTPDSNGWVTVSYDASGEAELPRAFALDIQLDGAAVIVDVNDNVNDDYTVHPGTIQIDENGNVTDDGTAVADDDPKCGVLGANCITIEMGSLYVGAANAPPASGDLLRFQVDNNCNVTITGNAIRGDIVLEDVTVADVNAPGCEVNDMACFDTEDPQFGQWQLQGGPESWCCPLQGQGDATGDGFVDTVDLFLLRPPAFNVGYGNANYDCRADFTHDGFVDTVDLFLIRPPNFNVQLGPPCTTTNPELDPDDCGS